MAKNKTDDTPAKAESNGAASWLKPFVGPIIVAVVALLGTFYATRIESNSLQEEIRTEAETSREEIRTQAAVNREELALEQDRLRNTQDKSNDAVLAEWIPAVVGDDVSRQLEALAVLAAVMPDQIGSILDTVFALLTDQEGATARIIQQARDEANERAEAVAWVIVVGERQGSAEAEALVAAASEKGFGSPQVYQTNGAYAVVLSGFETRDDADVALVSVRATVQEGAQVVDVNTWCPYPVADKTGRVSCASTTYDQAVLIDGPKVFWPLATPTAISLDDLMGNFNLLPRGDGGNDFVPVFSEGPNGIGGMEFDRTAQQRLNSKFIPERDLGTNSWTVETWIRLEETSLALADGDEPLPVTVIGGWNASAGKRWYFSVEKGRDICIGIGSAKKVCATGTTVNDGKWHHVVVMYQAEEGVASLFFDSVNAELASQPWNPGERLIDATVSIGAMFNDNVTQVNVTKGDTTKVDDGQGWEEYWSGGLSRLAVYEGLLGEEKIRTHFEAVGDL